MGLKFTSMPCRRNSRRRRFILAASRAASSCCPQETGLALRTGLGARGATKGDLSKFIEESVRGRIFHCSLRGHPAAQRRRRQTLCLAVLDTPESSPAHGAVTAVA